MNRRIPRLNLFGSFLVLAGVFVLNYVLALCPAMQPHPWLRSSACVPLLLLTWWASRSIDANTHEES